MKKKLILIIGIIIVLLVCIYVFFFNNKKEDTSKVTLDDIYYKKSDAIDVTNYELEDLLNNKGSFLLYVYNSYCTFKIPCETIFEEYLDSKNITMLKIAIDEFKNTSLYSTIKYAPSFVIISDGEIVAFLDANSDEDLNRYQDTDEFGTWLSSYINLK